MLPEPRALYVTKTKHRLYQGIDTIKNSRFFDELVVKNTPGDMLLYCHLMLDKMKLKYGILVNMKYYSVVGFF